MKKINVFDVLKILKDIFIKTCVYFTFMTLGITAVASFLNLTLNSDTYLMFALSALGAGTAVQIFKIEILPAVSRHIAFFILLYLDFLLIFIPLSKYTTTANTTFYLSIIFIVFYLIIFGIVMGISAVINSVRNKNLKYEKQFKSVK